MGQGKSIAKGSGGGWNSGGHVGPQGDSGAGGGATDIRLGGTSLSGRIIVTGGGGGGYCDGQTRNGDVGAYGGSSYVGNLNNGNMVDGTKSMPNPNGGTMVGNTDHGYARITYVVN